MKTEEHTLTYEKDVEIDGIKYELWIDELEEDWLRPKGWYIEH